MSATAWMPDLRLITARLLDRLADGVTDVTARRGNR